MLLRQQFDAGAKGAVVSGEAVGVLEPSGRFVLARLQDGKKIVEDKLKAENALVGIYLLANSSQYILVTNTPPTNVQANVNINRAGRIEQPGRQRPGLRLCPGARRRARPADVGRAGRGHFSVVGSSARAMI